MNDTIRSLRNQVEQLNEELNDGEMLRQQLIQENNELQKQVSHEKVVIPQLESELKTLTQENDYLKLLGKFRKERTDRCEKVPRESKSIYSAPETYYYINSNMIISKYSVIMFSEHAILSCI